MYTKVEYILTLGCISRSVYTRVRVYFGPRVYTKVMGMI